MSGTPARAAGVEAPAALIAGAVGVVALGAFRLMYSSFYGTFGIALDELGLSPWHMMTAAIAGWLGLLAAVFPVAIVFVALGRLVGRRTDGITAWAVATLAAVAIFYAAIHVLTLHHRAVGAILTLAGTGLVAGALACRLWWRQYLERALVRQAAATTLCLAAVGIVTMWISGYAAAGDAARSIQPDGSVRQGTWALTVLDIQRTPVCITGLVDAIEVPARSALLLGSAGGTTLLLEITSEAVVHRIPTASLQITTLRRSGGC